jgi:predicted metal-binding membrane protein
VRVALTLAGLSLAAWVMLLMGGANAIDALLCTSADRRGIGSPLPLLVFASPASLVAGWALMVLAMMPPLIALPLLHVRAQSLARRRRRAMLLFAAGYGSVWLAAGLLLQPLAWVLPSLAPGAPWAGITVAAMVALVWQMSPAKQACLNGCHRQPALAAFGLEADFDALGFGVGHALWCVAACGPLMLLAESVQAIGLWLAMPAAALFILAERFEWPGPFVWRLRLPLRAARVAANRLRRSLVVDQSRSVTANAATAPRMTTSHGGAFHEASSSSATAAIAKSAGARIALVQTGV